MSRIVFAGDSTRLAPRASDAAVDVVLDVTTGVPPVFQAFVDSLDETGQDLDRAALFISQHLRIPSRRSCRSALSAAR